MCCSVRFHLSNALVEGSNPSARASAQSVEALISNGFRLSRSLFVFFVSVDSIIRDNVYFLCSDYNNV